MIFYPPSNSNITITDINKLSDKYLYKHKKTYYHQNSACSMVIYPLHLTKLLTKLLLQTKTQNKNRHYILCYIVSI